jgi:hypothetical protein
MPRFSVTTEATEDILATADNLPDAIRAAREVTLARPVGELVLVEANGRGVCQFTLRRDGTVEEIDIDPIPKPTAKAF